jgi:hypothetical protein
MKSVEERACIFVADTLLRNLVPLGLWVTTSPAGRRNNQRGACLPPLLNRACEEVPWGKETERIKVNDSAERKERE